MRARGFWFWLVLFVSGSALWLWPLPWAELMGRLVVFLAGFIGVTAPSWRAEPYFKTARAVVSVQFANLLPMFVIGSLPNRTPLLTAIYLVAGVVVLAINSYAGLSPRHSDAA